MMMSNPCLILSTYRYMSHTACQHCCLTARRSDLHLGQVGQSVWSFSAFSNARKKEPGTFITPQVHYLLTSFSSVLQTVPSYYEYLIILALLQKAYYENAVEICMFAIIVGLRPNRVWALAKCAQWLTPDVDTVHWVAAGCQNSHTTLISKQ